MNVGAKTNQRLENSAGQTITVIGFGRRLIAALIDGLLVGFLTFVLTVCIGFVALLFDIYVRGESFPFDKLIILCGAIFSIAYYIGYWTKSGQTLGKTMTGIKIVSTDGAPISAGKAVLRYIGYIVSGIILSLGFLWVAFDRKRQGWHDKIANTYVVYVDDNFSGADAVKFVPSDPERNWIWLIIWIILVIVTPVGFGSGVWILGPVINQSISNMLESFL